MNIPKAIELLTIWKEPESIEESEELHKARELGIEALKAVISARDTNYWTPIPLLPGED